MKHILRLIAVNFLGQSPAWYKIAIVSFLVLNPLLFFFVSPFVTGWVVLIQFIFSLACALKCYPLQPGGLLAIEALVIGLTTPETIYHEVQVNVPTLLLLIFMVSAIYFIKDVLFIAMTKLFLVFRKKYMLALFFCLICASLSAFLDALTLVAIAIAVCFNFYAIYHRVESHSGNEVEMEEFRGFLRNMIIHGTVGTIIGGTMTIVGEPNNMMIGTKMGWSFLGFIVRCAPISVPAAIAGFIVCFSLEYFKLPGFHYQMSERARELILKDYTKKIHAMTGQNFYVYVVQIVVFILLVLALAFHAAEVGLIGIGLIIIVTTFTGQTKEHDLGGAFTNAMPFAMLIVVFFAILGVVHEQNLVDPLANWVFEFSGTTQHIVLYFTNGMLSFTSDNVFIATVFINAVEAAYAGGIIAQMMPSIVTAHESGTLVQFISETKIVALMLADIEAADTGGTLAQLISEAKTISHGDVMTKFISDLESANTRGTISQFVNESRGIYSNQVFTQFIDHVDTANVKGTVSAFLESAKHDYAGKTPISREEYEKLAVVVNMGTNIPAMATPNGHAALLFLLTSALAPLLKLSYFQMFKLTLPYTIAMTITGALAIYFFL